MIGPLAPEKHEPLRYRFKRALLLNALFFVTVTAIVAPFLPETENSRSWPRCSAGATDCVVDGDTFRSNGQTIRIADIDAPETGSAKCASEAELGRKATERLRTMLGEAPFTMTRYSDRDRDSYGRLLRVVRRDGRSIGLMLVSEGLARPWGGGRRPWCV